MALDPKIRDQIAEIASRPRSVRFVEVDRLLKRLGSGNPRRTKHGWMYKIGSRRLMLNEHNNGKPHLPKYSVDEFLAMATELGYDTDVEMREPKWDIAELDASGYGSTSRNVKRAQE